MIVEINMSFHNYIMCIMIPVFQKEKYMCSPGNKTGSIYTDIFSPVLHCIDCITSPFPSMGMHCPPQETLSLYPRLTSSCFLLLWILQMCCMIWSWAPKHPGGTLITCSALALFLRVKITYSPIWLPHILPRRTVQLQFCAEELETCFSHLVADAIGQW